jgi:hypothetical protein
MSVIKDAIDAAKELTKLTVRDFRETQPRSPGSARKLEGTKAPRRKA